MLEIGPDTFRLYVQKAFVLAGRDDCLQGCADDAVMLAQRSTAARCETGRDQIKSCASSGRTFL